MRGFFDAMRPSFARLAGRLLDDAAAAEAAVERAGALFEEMIPGMAYVDQAGHPMASAVFGCNAHLAMHLALKERGVDAHVYGRAMLAAMAAASKGPSTPSREREGDDANHAQAGDPIATLIAAGNASQKDAAPGEFVFEAYRGDGGDLDWGMNVTSCAICASYSKYDAMDLVPYMCATDDVMSDRDSQGLKRTGTIAVGAHRCDFRYKRGREGEHLSAKYPEKIRS